MLRVPNDIDQAYSLGLDYREWIRQGIVDVLVGETYWGRLDTMADFRPLVEAVKGSDCRAFATINSIVSSDRLLSGTIEMTRATACNYWQQGVDGLYLAQWFAGANWPYRADFYAQLREIDHPDIMAPKDKFYTVMTKGDYGGTRGIPASEAQPTLPVELKPGQTSRVEFTIRGRPDALGPGGHCPGGPVASAHRGQRAGAAGHQPQRQDPAGFVVEKDQPDVQDVRARQADRRLLVCLQGWIVNTGPGRAAICSR